MPRVAFGLPPRRRWNHNTLHHRVILDAARRGGRRPDTALDVGCGTGQLARTLAAHGSRVVGVDADPRMVALARQRSEGVDGVEFVHGTFPDVALPRTEFDLVTSLTAVHHMDFTEALTTLAARVAPGGTLVVVGLARDHTPVDVLVGAVAAGWQVVRIVLRGRPANNPDGMPVRDARMSWGEVRRAARTVLPGVRYRRHLLWRYSLVWERER